MIGILSVLSQTLLILGAAGIAITFLCYAISFILHTTLQRAPLPPFAHLLKEAMVDMSQYRQTQGLLALSGFIFTASFLIGLISYMIVTRISG